MSTARKIGELRRKTREFETVGVRIGDQENHYDLKVRLAAHTFPATLLRLTKGTQDKGDAQKSEKEDGQLGDEVRPQGDASHLPLRDGENNVRGNQIKVINR